MSTNDYTFDEISAITKSLARNNTFCPNIDRTIFNLSKKHNEETNSDDYILATTVFFVDGTKVTVKNCLRDKISVETETIRLSDDTRKEVETASLESREVGIAYAILKRMVCVPDEKGEVKGGFGSFLNKAIENSWNQSVEEVRIKSEKDISKANFKDTPKKENDEKPSLRKCVRDLSELLSELKNKLA